MDSRERRYRMKWAIITVGGALVATVGLYAIFIDGWSGSGVAGD